MFVEISIYLIEKKKICISVEICKHMMPSNFFSLVYDMIIYSLDVNLSTGRMTRS